MTQITQSFADLGLSPELLKAVGDAGYEKPTPIQEKSIPLVLMGRDLLGCAQTGTGKTASFSLPIIDILAQGRARARMPRALVLSPTRELAHQISDFFTTYNKFHDLGQAVLIGGESMPEQERSLAKDPDVIIATPGRLIDMFERGKVMLGGIKILVIDEADRMLDMGFIPDVTRIVGSLPRIRQTLLFSATLGAEIRALADAFLINPKEVSVAPSASIAQTVKHSMISVPKYPKEKRAALRKVMASEDVQIALVFCNRKKDISVLRNSLRRHGFEAEELHGDMAQHRRTETLAAYKSGDIKLLVCSDVAGRGLDIEGVSHVFNFDVPNHAESYVHRIGRTGRAGREGRAITLVTSEDAKYVDAILKLIRVDVPLLPLNDIGTQAPGPASERLQDAGERGQGSDTVAREAKESANKTWGRRAGSGINTSKKNPARAASDHAARSKRPTDAER
ncbi:MAG: DEAD/DEAH box helicase, partial [Alphaproteobacteria bacterium]